MGTYVDINACKERLVTVLDRIGYLSIEQAKKINFNNVLSNAAIRELCSENRAFMSENRKFLLRQPWRKPWPPIINAIDVMLPFLVNIDINSIFVKEFIPKEEKEQSKEKAQATNQDRLLIGFAKNGRMYEVYDAKDKKSLENLYLYLAERHKNFLESGGDETGIRYLIMVPNKSLFLYATKDVSYLYAFAYLEKTESGVETKFFNPQSDTDVEFQS